VKLLLDNPSAGAEDLLEVVQGPDFPSGALLFVGPERSRLREVVGTGRGLLTMQAVHRVEESARGNRTLIVFTELPYQTNKAALIEQIAGLVRDRKVEGIGDLRDESDRHGVRVVVELKRDGQLQTVLAQLYKQTALKSTFAVNMLALVDGQPRTISLKQALEAFIAHRREIIRRRSEFDLARARERHHIVEGLLKAIAQIRQVIEAIRQAESADAAKARLQQRPFSLSERQAQAVLDMQLRRLAALERGKLEEERAELAEEIAYLEGVLADPRKVDGLIKDDLDDLTATYAGERRTKILPQDAEDFSEEDLVAHQTTVITISREGYIKRMPLATYRKQQRGGKGLTAMKTRTEDEVRHLVVADTHDTLLLFTNRGRVFSLKAHEVEERTREWRGLPLRNLIQTEEEEPVTAVVAAAALETDFLLLATRAGVIKKTPLSDFSSVRRAGLIAFNLAAGDELVAVAYAHAGDDVVALSSEGHAVRFAVAGLRSASRASGGVRAIRVPDQGALVGLEVVRRGADLLTITARGFGKRTPEAEFPRKQRGGKGMIAHKVTDKTGPVVGLHQVRGDEEIVLISAEGKFIRTLVESVGRYGRATQGVRVMDTEGLDVAAVAVVDPGAVAGG
jgi:DNA gyrase subunit A